MAFDESDPVVTGTKYGYQNEMDKRSVNQIFHGTVTANNNSFLVTDSGDLPDGAQTPAVSIQNGTASVFSSRASSDLASLITVPGTK